MEGVSLKVKGKRGRKNDITLRDRGTVNTIKMGLEKGAKTTSRIFFVGLSGLHNLIHGPL
jgi:hypothetical protein